MRTKDDSLIVICHSMISAFYNTIYFDEQVSQF